MPEKLQYKGIRVLPFAPEGKWGLIPAEELSKIAKEVDLQSSSFELSSERDGDHIEIIATYRWKFKDDGEYNANQPHNKQCDCFICRDDRERKPDA